MISTNLSYPPAATGFAALEHRSFTGVDLNLLQSHHRLLHHHLSRYLLAILYGPYTHRLRHCYSRWQRLRAARCVQRILEFQSIICRCGLRQHRIRRPYCCAPGTSNSVQEEICLGHTHGLLVGICLVCNPRLRGTSSAKRGYCHGHTDSCSSSTSLDQWYELLDISLQP